jgi:hypothetical protein
VNPLWFSILLCLVAGAAIDGGHICIVRAARELGQGRPRLVVSCSLTVACATLVLFVETYLHRLERPLAWSWPEWTTLAGAILFAAGALINGACALGTLGRLARGDLGYTATIAGGVAITALFASHAAAICRTPTAPWVDEAVWLVFVSGSVLALLIGTRSRLHFSSLTAFVALGVAGAILANRQSDWGWLSLAISVGEGMTFHVAAVLYLGAVLTAGTASALFRRRFRFVSPDPRRAMQRAAGGALMAAGAILIPGGNDSLLVVGLPSADPNAIAAYAVMLLAMFFLLRRSAYLRGLSDWSKR